MSFENGATPCTWQQTTIGQVCKISTGKLDVNASVVGGEYPFFTCAERIYQIDQYAFDTEAVLFAGNGDFNVKYYKGKFNAYQRTYVLHDLALSGRYLFHYISHRMQIITGGSRGSTIKYIRLSDLRDHPISVPSREVQAKIVDEIEMQLSRLDAAVANLQRVKANLKRYKASVLKDAVEGRLVPTEAELARREGRSFETGEQFLQRTLEARRKQWNGKGKFKEPAAPIVDGLPELPEGWAWARLDSVAALKGGITVDSKRADPMARVVPYLRVANVQRCYLDLAEIKQIIATAADVAELRLEFGDILFNEGGDRDKLGRGWIWENQVADCIHQNHVFRARMFLPEMVPKLISWWGNTFGKEYFQRVGKQTTNLASINLGKLSEFPVPIPPAAEQLRLVAEIERLLSVVDRVAAEVEANLKRAQALRQAVLARAFASSSN